MATELAPVNPEYVLASRLAAPVSVQIRSGHTPDPSAVTELRDAITDEQCGRYRECWTLPSDIPGCGARISRSEEGDLTAECPAGTMFTYEACAKRVLSSIASQLEAQT